jgi:glycogen debranching enzyme
MAHFNRIPHTPYYGTADATPLYLIVLHETWKWTGDIGLRHEYRDVAIRSLEWIDRYGDLDADGLQEFNTRSPQSIDNQGWKDSGDSIVYPDGTQVTAPIALCEIQGYVFDAWMRMAEVFTALGETDRAIALQHKVAELRDRVRLRSSKHLGSLGSLLARSEIPTNHYSHPPIPMPPAPTGAAPAVMP